jgi:hypothetical protein
MVNVESEVIRIIFMATLYNTVNVLYVRLIYVD